MPKAKKPNKPYPGFPLTAHPVGQWCKRINYTLYYFGPWADPLAARDKYLAERDNIQAGRPRNADTAPPGPVQSEPGGITVQDLVNRFLHVKQKRVESGELAARSYAMYKRAGLALGEFFGASQEVEKLTADDFERYREHLAKGVKRTVGVRKGAKPKPRSLVSLENEIRTVKIVFNFAFDQGLIDKPLRLKAWLEGPSDKAMRAESNAKPLRMLEAVDVRRALAVAGPHMRAMILLGINCGFGNIDIATLPRTAVDFSGGWIDHARPKTEVKRRVALWPETIEAIQASMAIRPTPKDPADAELVFVTKYGYRFVRSSVGGAQRDSVAQEFKKLLTGIGITQTGLNFYCLRAGFETVAGDSLDQVATDQCMGHTPKKSDMAAVYRRRITDERLRNLASYVRKWLWPEGSEAAWLAAQAERAGAKESE